MPIALEGFPSAWPASLAPDADLRTRLRVAIRNMQALQALFARLESTLWFNLGIIQDQDDTSTEREQATWRRCDASQNTTIGRSTPKSSMP
jgi:hypothetical protein